MNIIKRVEELKKEIKQTEENRNKLEGKLEQLIQELKDKYDVSTLEEAKEILEAYKEEIEIGEQKIEKELTEIENKMRS